MSKWSISIGRVCGKRRYLYRSLVVTVGLITALLPGSILPVTSVVPTGSISLLVGTSAGIEPFTEITRPARNGQSRRRVSQSRAPARKWSRMLDRSRSSSMVFEREWCSSPPALDRTSSWIGTSRE